MDLELKDGFLREDLKAEEPRRRADTIVSEENQIGGLKDDKVRRSFGNRRISCGPASVTKHSTTLRRPAGPNFIARQQGTPKAQRN